MSEARAFRARRIEWLKANSQLWDGLTWDSPDLRERRGKIIDQMVSAGLYSVNTNLIDIRLIPLLDQIRRQRRGTLKPKPEIKCLLCSSKNGYDTKHARPKCKLEDK